MIKNHIFSLVMITTIACIGAIWLLYATNVWGIGVEVDSVVFLSGADNLRNHHELVAFMNGKTSPLTHFPPLYPIVLALSGVVDMPILEWARIVHAIVFAANSGLVGVILYRFTRGSWWLAAIGAYAMIVMPDNFLLHATLMTEPIFLFCALLGLFLLALAVEKQHTGLLIAAALAIGAAFLQRYVGITLVATGVIELFFLGNSNAKSLVAIDSSSSKERTFSIGNVSVRLNALRDAVLFGIIACLPMVLWVVRNMIVANTATNRVVAFHPVSIGHIQTLIFTMFSWIIPYTILDAMSSWIEPLTTVFSLDLSFRILLVILGIIALAFIWYKRPRKQTTSHSYDIRLFIRTTPLLRIFTLFSVIYPLFLFFSISFLDFSTPLNYRILLPLYHPLLIIVLCVVWHILKKRSSIRLYAIVMSTCLFIVGLYTISVYDVTQFLHNQGWWYNSKYWHTSQLIEHIKALPTDTSIYSNAPDAIYVLTDRETHSLPLKEKPTSNQVQQVYEQEMSMMVQDIEQHGAILIYFSDVSWRFYLPSEEELKQQIVMQPILQTPKGTMYATLSSQSFFRFFTNVKFSKRATILTGEL